MEGGVRKMFWGKKSAKEEEKKEKLSGPKEIPGPVRNYLAAERKMDPDLVKLLKAVERKSTTGATFNIRVFDDSAYLSKCGARKHPIRQYSGFLPRASRDCSG